MPAQTQASLGDLMGFSESADMVSQPFIANGEYLGSRSGYSTIAYFHSFPRSSASNFAGKSQMHVPLM